MLPEGQRPEDNIEQLRDIIFQCWSRLAANICFVISWNVSIAVKNNVVNSLPTAGQSLDGAACHGAVMNKPNTNPKTNPNPNPIP